MGSHKTGDAGGKRPNASKFGSPNRKLARLDSRMRASVITLVFLAATAIPPLGPIRSDTIWPYLGISAWLGVLATISCLRLWPSVTGNLRQSPRLRATEAILIGLLVPAYLGWVSPGLSALGASTLYLSAGFQRPALGLLVVLFFGGLVVAPVELALLAIGNLSEVASLPGLTDPAQQLYGRFSSLLQYERECSRFDPELLYSLRPGRCVFENAEFRTAIEVNQLGLRDSEAALTRPEVAFLGDSYTAGCGVDQDESFVELVETKTHLRTVNVAAPSYGTPREFGLFSRIDVPTVRYIVLQYCPNDYEENLAFVEADFIRENPNEEAWNALTEWHSAHKRYYPGKYFAYALQGVIRRALSPVARTLGVDSPTERETEPDGPSEPHALRLILEHFAEVLTGRHVYVISPCGFQVDVPLDGLDAELQHSEILRDCCVLETVRLEDVLEPSDRFVLDTHLNAQGHQKIAEKLSQLILERERSQARPSGRGGDENQRGAGEVSEPF